MKEILLGLNAYNEKKESNYQEFINFLNQDEEETIFYLTEGLKNLNFVLKDYLVEIKKCKPNNSLNELIDEYLNSNDLIKTGYLFQLDKIIDKKYSTRDKEMKIKNAFLGLVNFIYESSGYSALKKILFNQVFAYSTIFNFNKIELSTFFKNGVKNLRLVSELIHHETNKVIEIYENISEPYHYLFYLNHKLFGESKNSNFEVSIFELSNQVFKNFIFEKFENNYYENIQEEINNTPLNEKRIKIKELFPDVRFLADFKEPSNIDVFIGDDFIFQSKGENKNSAIDKANEELFIRYFYNEIAQKYNIDKKIIENCSNFKLMFEFSQEHYDILWDVLRQFYGNEIDIKENNETYSLYDVLNNKVLLAIKKTQNPFNDKYNLFLKFLWNNIYNFEITWEQLLERDDYFAELFVKIQELIVKIKQKYNTKNIEYVFDDDLKVSLYINNEYIDSNYDDYPVVALYNLLNDIVSETCELNANEKTNVLFDLSEQAISKWEEIIDFYKDKNIKLYCPNNNENYFVFEINGKLNDQLIGNDPIDAQEKLIAKVYEKIEILRQEQKNKESEINNSIKNKSFVVNEFSSENIFKIGNRKRRLTDECLKKVFSSIDSYENIRVKLLAKFNNKQLSYKIENERILLYLNNVFLVGEQRGYSLHKTMEKLLTNLVNNESISLRLEKNSNNNYDYDNYAKQSKYILNYFENNTIKFIIDNLDHQHVQFIVDNQVHYDFKFKNSDNVIIQAVNIIYNLLKDK